MPAGSTSRKSCDDRLWKDDDSCEVASVSARVCHHQRSALVRFPSPDSDFDLRGVHLLPLETVVGLDAGQETVEKEGNYDGLEIDLVTHDAAKVSA